MMSDKETNLQELKDSIQKFCEDRDWGPFHSAKDLAIGAVTESAELLEPFRFLTADQVEALMADNERRQEISDELADVLFFLLRFSQKYQLDLSEAFSRKMKKNGERYPVSQFKGKNHKAKNMN